MFIRYEMQKGRPLRRPFFLASAMEMGMAMMALSAEPAHAAMRGYIVTSFDTLKAEAPVRVVLTTGTGVNATGEGERSALDRVVLAVSGGVLTISVPKQSNPGFASGKAQPVPTLYLSTDQIRRVQVTGGAVVTVKELTSQAADLSLNGNGEIIVQKANVDKATFFVAGGGRLTISGRAKDVRATVTGPGEINAEALDTRGATIANDGPGSIRLMVNGPVKVSSSGSGDTVISGKPICTIDQRGVGQVVCAQ